MIKYVTPDTFDFEAVKKTRFQLRKQGNPGTKDKTRYLEHFATFDIETSGIPELEQSFMYVWMFYFRGQMCMGRTWEEFIDFCSRFKAAMRPGCRCVVYVHNLSYEFQFLRGIYDFKPEEVFATEARRVLKCSMFDAFDLRCSYMLTNMSLARFTQSMGVEHGKLSGAEFDYSKIRYPWTELTEYERQYCANDVIGLHEAITARLERDEDNLYSIPLTSTGYVRREVKQAMRAYNHKQLRAMLPDYELYKVLRQAFRGGNTHANRWYVGKVLTDVNSWDIASSYPTVICECRFPMRKFDWLGPVSNERYRELLEDGRAVLCQASFYNIRLKDSAEGFPYLPLAKCRNYYGDGKKYRADNGRFLSADYLETSFTDIDFSIIENMYTWDRVEFWNVYESSYGPLPMPLVGKTLEYFQRKTELKGVEGQDYYYARSKELLNSIYGMMVQDPVKQSIDFDYSNLRLNVKDFIERQDNPAELLEAANRKAFLFYAWGVWVTAWARLRLQRALDLAGQQAVYCDTDSVKYVGELDLSDLNGRLQDIAVDAGAYAVNRDGEPVFMGVFEHDAFYNRFVTLGAKKYAYEDSKGVHVTTAGVNKALGGVELAEAGGVDAYREGFIFRKAGGTESVYNDAGCPFPYVVDGREIPLTANVYIKDSTYTLGITDEYRRVLEHPSWILAAVRQVNEDSEINPLLF